MHGEEATQLRRRSAMWGISPTWLGQPELEGSVSTKNNVSDSFEANQDGRVTALIGKSAAQMVKGTEDRGESMIVVVNQRELARNEAEERVNIKAMNYMVNSRWHNKFRLLDS